MTTLFEPSVINGMKLANRFVRSATWEGMATDDGSITPRLVETMVNLAKGEVGLIISGHAYVSREGQAGPWQLAIDRDSLIGGLREMTAAVHDSGGTIVAQLAHAGIFGAKKLTGMSPVSVSRRTDSEAPDSEQLTEVDIKRVIKAFSDAAARAKDAGFDGIQIHSAHGYLLSQFLSPAYNRRDDEYGGSIENRARIHTEICHAIRKAVGSDYPLMIKINCEDYLKNDNGLKLSDSLAAASLIAGAGVDAIELSGGTFTSGKLSPSRTGINKEEKEAYFRTAATEYKKNIALPLMLVGGVRSLNVAEEIVSSGTADYISMCRPFIREPDLIKRWRSGEKAPAMCKSDNLCFTPGLEGRGIFCVVDELEKKKK